MSDQITSCPEQEELRKCVFNQLPTNELEAIKAHVKMCPKCRVSFTTILKEKVAKENQGIGPIPPATKNVADSPFKPAEPPPKKVDDSHSTPQKVITPALKPAYPFLDPPTKAGGIGCLGDYELIRVLGEGGMGIVFEADDKN